MRQAIGVVLVLATVTLAGCGSGGTSPSDVAQAAGAASCDDSGFYVESKLTHEKETIYDCRFATKLPKCVTYSGNMASDATAEVQLVFSNSINSKGPPCLTWVKQAKTRLARLAAKRAAAKRLAEAKAFQAALARDAHAQWHQGYTPYWKDITGTYELPNVYFKWIPVGSIKCADFAMDGCWNVGLVTRNGCPTGVYVQLNEMADGTQIGTVYGSTGSLEPFTPAVVEIDSDQSQSLQGQLGSITCN